QADFERSHLRGQVVEQPHPRAVTLIGVQVARWVVPALPTIFRILPGVADHRTAAGVLPDQVAGEPRPCVCAADVELREEAIAELRMKARVLAIVDSVVAADDREVVQSAELVGGSPR